MTELSAKTRKLNPTERRLTMRESFKYYNALAVAGIYHFPEESIFGELSRPESYFSTLRRCVERHPMLATTIKDATTKDERYVHVETMDLHNHINILGRIPGWSTAAPEDDQVAHIMEHFHNDSELAIFNRPQEIPPWRLDILPLVKSPRRVFISFTYSHSIGDGMSGSIFHSTFLSALNERLPAAEASFAVEEAAIPALPYLPVSLSFLLAPALGHYLPKFITRFFGLKASVSGCDGETWVGTKIFDNRPSPSQPVRTAVQIFSVDHATLSAVLNACRARKTKLTALLNELIALCMSRRLEAFYVDFSGKTNLVSCIPINLRKVSGVPADALGNIAGGTYSQHPITRTAELIVDDGIWARACVQSANTAASASKLQDQATGLLGWISDMRSWTEGQLGQARDSSWELSNLMAFDGEKGSVTVEKMYFCQPANLVGQPIGFDTISVKGRDLVICVAWQTGSLGLDSTDALSVDENERKLVLEVLEDLRTLLKLIAES